MLTVGTHESNPGWPIMRETLRQRGSLLRLETTLIRLAMIGVVVAGAWFLRWQLGHVIGISG